MALFAGFIGLGLRRLNAADVFLGALRQPAGLPAGDDRWNSACSVAQGAAIRACPPRLLLEPGRPGRAPHASEPSAVGLIQLRRLRQAGAASLPGSSGTWHIRRFVSAAGDGPALHSPRECLQINVFTDLFLSPPHRWKPPPASATPIAGCRPRWGLALDAACWCQPAAVCVSPGSRLPPDRPALVAASARA